MARNVAIFGLLVLFYTSFGVRSYMATGDLWGLIASLPVFLCAAGIVAVWMSLIGMDADEVAT